MTLKRCVMALALLAAPALAEDEAEGESKWEWVIHSGDGKAILRQKPATPGKCFLECTGPDGAVAWKAKAACLADKSDMKFLSVDCERTVVIIPAPPRGAAWRATQVMRVYKREKLDYPVMGIAVLPDGEKSMKASRAWAKGTYGIPGDPPKYSADAMSIEYEAIDGKKGSVPLKKE